ncbi:hypothetical protein ACHQM5_008381 [Ranunculus cassubicifolius]
MGSSHLNVFSFFFFFILVTSGPNLSESARVFTIINNCKDTVWPGITPGDYFDGGGFSLIPGQSKIFTAPLSWTGRIWGRTGCSFNKSGVGMMCHADVSMTSAGRSTVHAVTVHVNSKLIILLFLYTCLMCKLGFCKTNPI